MAKDLICGMNVDEKTTKFKSEYEGQTYYFCALTCKQTFDKEPSRYVKN
jgi:YHS domain-containing protein